MIKETAKRLARAGFKLNKIIQLAHKALVMTNPVTGAMVVINYLGQVIFERPGNRLNMPGSRCFS